MSADYLRLKGVTQAAKPLVSRQIKENLIGFFDWSIMNAGGFSNVTLQESGTYGGDRSRLRFAQDPRYTDGQVWEGFTNSWIWESGLLDFSQPIHISGVWVNNVFRPASGVGQYAHTINYRDGQVIFTTPIPTGSRVQCEFSYKWIKVIDAESRIFREIIQNADKVNDPQFFSTSGNYNTLSQERVPLPVLGIKISPRFRYQGQQLGGGHWYHQDVNFDILAGDEDTRNQLKDIVMYQVDKLLVMYDYNAQQPSLNYDGTLGSNPKTYADLVTSTASGTAYKTMYFEEMAGLDLGSLDNRLWCSSVRSTMFVYMPEI